MCGSLGGVVCFAAADADDQITAGRLKIGHHTVNFTLAAFAVEGLINRGAVGACNACIDRGCNACLPGGSGEDKQLFAEHFHMLAQVLQFAFALDIAGGACNDVCHKKTILSEKAGAPAFIVYCCEESE